MPRTAASAISANRATVPAGDTQAHWKAQHPRALLRRPFSTRYNIIMDLHEKLNNLSITLPPASGPFGAYVPAKRVGNLIYVAGQLPMKEGKLMALGQIPSRCSVEDA